MMRTIDEWLTILRSDPNFMDFLRRSGVLDHHFTAHTYRGHRLFYGRTITPSSKAVQALLGSQVGSGLYLYLEQQYGMNVASTRVLSRLKHAMIIWMAEIWDNIDHA